MAFSAMVCISCVPIRGVYIRACAVLFFFFQVACVSGQQCHTDSPCVRSRAGLELSIRKDRKKQLIDLKKLIPELHTEIRYATTRNFTGKVLYQHPLVLLRAAPAKALQLAEEELNRKGLALKIFDAFRPYSVTCAIWRLVPDRHYAANPVNGSNHNRGVAVDITIVDLKTGKELDMGTDFDDFTDSAHHDFYQLPSMVLANRRLLKQTMRKYGFDIVPSEWWHYQWRDRGGYEIIDLDFDEIRPVLL